MAKIEFKGLAEYSAKLDRLSALCRDEIINAAVREGGGVLADAIRAELNAVPTDSQHEKIKVGPTPEEKQGLQDSMGITPIRDDDGFVNVKVGFDGYQGKPTPKYPRGKPNQMIARSVQSGTSFMRANPFVKNAVRKARPAAVAAMKKKVEDKIDKIMD